MLSADPDRFVDVVPEEVQVAGQAVCHDLELGLKPARNFDSTNRERCVHQRHQSIDSRHETRCCTALLREVQEILDLGLVGRHVARAVDIGRVRGGRGKGDGGGRRGERRRRG